jgi:hypothetical protein
MRAFSCRCHGDGAISTAMMHKMNNELFFISPYEAGKASQYMWFSCGFYGLAAAAAATHAPESLVLRQKFISLT